MTIADLTTQPTSETKHKRLVITAVILLDIVFASLSILTVIPLMFSPMLFDAPGSEKNPLIYLFILALLLFPLISCVSFILSIIKLADYQYRKALKIALLPFAGILFVLLCAVLMSAIPLH